MTGGAKSITREEIRAFKKVWAELANPRTGYLERANFVRFFGVCHHEYFSYLCSPRLRSVCLAFSKYAYIPWNTVFLGYCRDPMPVRKINNFGRHGSPTVSTSMSLTRILPTLTTSRSRSGKSYGTGYFTRLAYPSNQAKASHSRTCCFCLPTIS